MDDEPLGGGKAPSMHLKKLTRYESFGSKFMRALNFVLVILIALGLVVFSLQNTQPATIQLISGEVEVEAPLAVELIVAAGFGGILAWLFILWSRVQQLLGDRATLRQIRAQEKRIQELQDTLQKYQGQTLSEKTEAKAEFEAKTEPEAEVKDEPKTEPEPETKAESEPEPEKTEPAENAEESKK